MTITGAELIVEALKTEGVSHIFGYPGGAVIPLFDVLYSHPELDVILTRHEQAAVHAADGYARSTGKTGVCIVTSGPGATNTITGLATANFDSVPVVCITGQVPSSMIGNDAFQEADTIGISRPVTKHNFLITCREDVGIDIKKAFLLAGSGRPGPVVVDIPKNVFTASSDDGYPDSVYIRGYRPVYKPDEEEVRKAAALLNSASRPLFFIGGGVHISGAASLLTAIAEEQDIPVVSSLMGIGAIPSVHPLYLGMIGMHGTFPANNAVSETDLLFSVGVRFDDRATGDLTKFAPRARIVHVDIDPTSIARNVPVDTSVVGDAKETLQQLRASLTKRERRSWLELIGTWKSEGSMRNDEHNDTGAVTPENVIQGINEVFPDAVITTEVGQNQMWAALMYHFKTSRTWLTSGGLGTMGYGFPAAIGAQIGNPGRRVIDIAGDGSIQMNIQELATAVHECLPVVVAILNNGYLGMVRQWQEIFHDRRYSSTCLKADKRCSHGCSTPGEECPPYVPDFVRLAEAYGAVGFRVESPDSIEPVLREAAAIGDRPIFIDFIIQREKNVYPMVPPGAGIQEMLL